MQGKMLFMRWIPVSFLADILVVADLMRFESSAAHHIQFQA